MSAGRIISGVSQLGFALGAIGLVARPFFYSVDAGETALIFDRLKGGTQSKIYGEGLHFCIPIVQKPIIYDVRVQPRQLKTVTGSKDLQTVSVTLRVLYRPHKEALQTIYKQFGLNYAERILPSIGNEVLKAVVAQYDAGELITQRELVAQKIRQMLVKRAAHFSITLEDVSITHLAFGDEFTAAIEQKQVAQQEAERSKFLVQKSEQEKLASIIRAEGEAEAARLISEAIAGGPGFIELRRIEAAREIAETLSKSRNITYLPSNSSNLLLNLGERA